MPATLSTRFTLIGFGRFKLLALLYTVLLIAAIVHYPFGRCWLALGFLLYLIILRYWPQSWLIIVPLALPALDLAPLSGRFFLDEFDLLLLATTAIAAWHQPSQHIRIYRLASPTLSISVLFIASTVFAMFIGAYPFPSPDINAFTNYYSPYNALRMGKGLIEAILLFPFLKHALEQNAIQTYRFASLGMTLGLCVTGIIILWERNAFPGLFDFNSNYRVAGMFSSMHIGGACIEAYLILTMPFAAWWTMSQRRWSWRIFGMAVFLLGIYAMVVTYARGGYIALTLGMVCLFLAVLLQKQTAPTWKLLLRGLALLTVTITISGLFLQGTYMQDRFASTQSDWKARATHWKDALNMMDDNLATTLFGMGLGRYPALYFWRSNENIRPTTYRFQSEANNIHLALGSGSPLYFEQIIGLQPSQRYRLSLSVRNQAEKSKLTFSICEKWILYSSTCITQSLKIDNTEGKWRRYTLEFDTGTLSKRPWHAYRPLKFSLLNPIAGSVVDLDNISLTSLSGKEWIQNGGWTQGMDHWFFSTDNHQPWHLENLWVQLYFEQGVIGLFSFFLLAIALCVILGRRYRDKEFPVPALAASLIGFLALGNLNSPFDFPRIAFLFYLLIAITMLVPHQERRNCTSITQNEGEKY